MLFYTPLKRNTSLTTVLSAETRIKILIKVVGLTLWLKGTHGSKKTFHANGKTKHKKQKNAGVAILIPDKMEFKTKARTKDKEGLGKEQADEDQFKWQADEDADEYLPEEMQSTNSKRHTHPYQRHLQ